MKKFFILCFTAFVMCSCGTIQTYTAKYYGSVTTFTPQGEVLQTWDNVLIDETTTEYNTLYGTTSVSKTSAFKKFGLNFIDMNTGKGVVVHTSIPYIIEYNTELETTSSTQTEEIKDDASSLEIKYHNLQSQISANKKEMRKFSKDSAEYKIKKEQNEALRNQMNEIEKKYIELTGMNMYSFY